MGTSGLAVTVPASIAQRLTAVEQLLAARTQGAGTVAVAIGVGSVGPVAVVFDKAMPDTGYAIVSATVEGQTGLAGVLVPAFPVLSKSVTGCSVQIRNTGLVAIGVGAVIRVTVEKFA